MHKGFKCLDPSDGRVYISRDIVFDEHVFPFAQLHPNAGARLRAELSLLPDILLNPSASFGDAKLLDQSDFSVSTNVVQDVGVATGETSEKHGSSRAKNLGNNVADHCHFMCNPGGGSAGAEHEMDSSAATSGDPIAAIPRSASCLPATTPHAHAPSGSSAAPLASPSPATTASQPQTDPVEGGSGPASGPGEISSPGSSVAPGSGDQAAASSASATTTQPRPVT